MRYRCRLAESTTLGAPSFKVRFISARAFSRLASFSVSHGRRKETHPFVHENLRIRGEGRQRRAGYNRGYANCIKSSVRPPGPPFPAMAVVSSVSQSPETGITKLKP